MGPGGYEGACYTTKQYGQINLAGVTNTNVSSSDFESGWFAGGGIDMPTPFLIPSTFVQIEYSHAETSGSGVALAGTTTTGKLENTTDGGLPSRLSSIGSRSPHMRDGLAEVGRASQA